MGLQASVERVGEGGAAESGGVGGLATRWARLGGRGTPERPYGQGLVKVHRPRSGVCSLRGVAPSAGPASIAVMVPATAFTWGAATMP